MTRDIRGAMSTVRVPRENLEEVLFKLRLEVSLRIREKKVFRLRERHEVHEM